MNCPDENIIVAFVDGDLVEAERAGVTMHLDSCELCVALVAEAVGHRSARGEQRLEAEKPPLSKGAAIGRYLILDLVGRGGMGDVYAAYDPKLDRRIALKLLKERVTSPLSVARFSREAQAVARLSHPNVVAIYDAGDFGDQRFLAMEFVEGTTLAEWLHSTPRSWREVRDVFVACGAGLAAAHEAGLVHRDFKPQNVMVGRDGSVRVTDFGLATDSTEIAEDEAASFELSESGAEPTARTLALTRTGVLLGTPLYMAPEQFLRRPTDARTDQFSFCVSLHEALYGERPFPAASLSTLCEAVISGRVREPAQRARTPSFMRRLLLRGLAAEPASRFPSMQALLDALRYDPVRRRRNLAVGATLAAIVAAGAVGALRAPRHAEPVCRGGPRRLADAWDLGGGPGSPSRRREATRDAFLKTGLSYAADVWEHTARIVDKYSKEWLRMYGDACEATQVRGEQSTEVLDLRMTCLSDRLSRIQALADVFGNATVTVVDNAAAAASALPSLDRCADVQLLRAVVPPPDDPQVRAKVAALKRDLAHVKALGDSGQCAGAAPAGQQLIAEAEKLGYRALEGDILVELVRWGPECMAPDELIRLCKRAVLDGVASRDLEVTAWAAIILATNQGDRTPDIAAARDWLDLGTATMQAMGRPDPVLEVWRLTALYAIYSGEGKLREGLNTLQRLRALMKKTQSTETSDYAQLLNNLGVVLNDMKRYEEALSYYRQAATLQTNLVGPHHVVVALAMLNTAEPLIGLHRYREAAETSERALEHLQRAGSNPFYEAVALTLRGEALLGAEMPSRATASLEAAIPLFGDDASSYPAEARFALARALWTQPQRRKRALALADRAKAGFEQLPRRAAEATAVDAWLRAHTEHTPVSRLAHRL
jgi:eukaryotic-like serine/threonine-protein kinase